MRPEKILIVEDEAIIAMTLEETLRGLGYSNVQHMFDEKTAYEAVLNEHFDLILMDVNLGGSRDGIDVIKSIKRTKSEIPFVYVTSYSDFKTITKAKYTQPEGYLIKPVDETDLMILLELVFHKKHEKELENEHIIHISESPSLNKLTKREMEVLNNIVMGYSNKMIADKMDLSDKTISVHRVNIMKKFHAKNTADLVRMVVANGYKETA